MCTHAALAKMLCLGKHAGKRFHEVADTDRNYCAWAVRVMPHGFERFAVYLRKTHGGIMCVGKYKGRFYNEIMADDPGYVQWARNLVDPSDAILDFIKFARPEAAPHDNDEPAPKRHCGGVCIMCCDSAINTACVPCGHAVACMECGARFSDDDCPICKQTVCIVLRTYGA